MNRTTTLSSVAETRNSHYPILNQNNGQFQLFVRRPKTHQNHEDRRQDPRIQIPNQSLPSPLRFLRPPNLRRRSSFPASPPNSQAPRWAPLLSDPHRGGGEKAKEEDGSVRGIGEGRKRR